MKRIIAFLALLLMTAGSCEGDDATTTITTTTITSTDAGAASSTTETADDAGSNSQSSAGDDFMTIWGIAPFGDPSVNEGFGAYTKTDNELSVTEDVLFMLDGADRDQVIDYYRGRLANEGYTISDVFEAGESRFFNATMDDDPNINGVVQVGPQSPGNSILGVHHQRVRMKDQESPADTAVLDSVGTEADGSVSESDDG